MSTNWSVSTRGERALRTSTDGGTGSTGTGSICRVEIVGIVNATGANSVVRAEAAGLTGNTDIRIIDDIVSLDDGGGQS